MSMTKNIQPQGCGAIRESHSVQVNNRIHYIADKLENLTGRLEEQLRPVLIPQEPANPSNEGILTPRRPALFEELHANLDVLDRWAGVISDITDRIEL